MPLRTLPTEWGAAGVTDRSLACFAEELPHEGRVRLEQVAADFLVAKGIDEPISWSPPIVDMTTAENADVASTLWPPSRPARTSANRFRSEESRAGTEWVSKCRTRW